MWSLSRNNWRETSNCVSSLYTIYPSSQMCRYFISKKRDNKSTNLTVLLQYYTVEIPTTEWKLNKAHVIDNFNCPNCKIEVELEERYRRLRAPIQEANESLNRSIRPTTLSLAPVNAGHVTGPRIRRPPVRFSPPSPNRRQRRVLSPIVGWTAAATTATPLDEVDGWEDVARPTVPGVRLLLPVSTPMSWTSAHRISTPLDGEFQVENEEPLDTGFPSGNGTDVEPMDEYEGFYQTIFIKLFSSYIKYLNN